MHLLALLVSVEQQVGTVDGADIAGEGAPSVRASCLSQIQSTKPERVLVKVPIISGNN